MSILDAMSTSVSGISTQSYALENISGNIANVSTVGFKRVDTGFSDMLGEGNPIGRTSTQTTAGSVAAYSEVANTIQGAITSTGVGTNMALSGDGLFVVAQNEGSATSPSFAAQSLYTRRGDFTQDANGYLVNGAGYYLCGTGAGPGASTTNSPIKISSAPNALGSALSKVSISEDGSIVGNYADGSTAKLAQVGVAHFGAADGLSREDGGAYSATSATGSPILGLNGATITGGSVEGSNTDISDQFSKMIVTQQAYSSNTKVLTTANEMLQTAINVLR